MRTNTKMFEEFCSFMEMTHDINVEDNIKVLPSKEIMFKCPKCGLLAEAY